ncbi:nitrate- and nitrite sensing domain-containing protein [Saccharomonospora xinjiangensis]|uniref:sensor histidine kinase n=1 Tax=Saccharomonospora xinjiangensis TaxID=75294 RepID=UPI0010704E2E|nr:nitrate- and nitrite sensing domain-containing protein [Saccharomonospora xinjiangensis]QBQ62489.1 sensor protein QseC [Saccharomonospora xinjiangensis]
MNNEDKPTQDNSSQGHHKSIRKRLTGTVLVPSIALLLLWIGMSTYFVIDAFYVRAVASSVQQVSIPAVTSLSAVQQERQLSLVYLEKRDTGLLELQQQQQQIDASLGTLRTTMDEIRSDLPDEIAGRMRDLEGRLERLPEMRSQINMRTIDPKEVNEYYNDLVATATDLFDAQARLVPDVDASQNGLVATDLFRTSDQMSRAASLASSAFSNGNFTPSDHRLFSELVGAYRSALNERATNMLPDVRQSYDTLVAEETWQRLQRIENELIAHGPGALDPNAFSVNGTELRDLTSQVSDDLASLAITQADQTSAKALNDAGQNLTNVLLGSALTLVAAIASIVVAVRVSRTLVDRTLMTRLERLRNDSLELASTRLPSIVARLKDGEAVDVSAELPRLDHGRDEIGQVAEAFNIAQLTAVNAAVSEAKARSGVNNVFLGIAHRNQGLVHRQLQILDRMESREENPSQLKSLFQLDNLATRARRTTENLIILGGKQPGRRWRKPVMLMDVLRAAISETEHFSRVEVEPIPDVALVGSAVADAIHLVAELVDNATTFSPPGSPVYMTGTKVARGVVVDIADQGLGMKDDVREWANGMMSEPPEFDAMAMKADASLGLFVVARLAHRLGAQVTFDSSRYGGTRATVLLPTDVLAKDEQTADVDSGFHATLAKAPEIEVHSPATSAPMPRSGASPTQPARANVAPVLERPAQQETAPAPQEGRHRVNGTAPAPTPTTQPSGADQVRTHDTETPVSHGSTSGTLAEHTDSAQPGNNLPQRRRRRAPLPQRRPQENLVDQLRDDPESEHRDIERYAGRTRSTLSAFHKGTRRGRDADDASRSTDGN